MTHRRCYTLFLLSTTVAWPALFASLPAAQAQPAGNGAAANGAAPRPGGPMDWNNMTPERRREVRQGMREPMLKSRLDQADFVEQTEIAPVLQYASAQEDARSPLREQSRTLAKKLLDAATREEDIATALGDLKRDTQAELEWQAGAEKMLADMTGYLAKPRLEAALTVLGLIGDEAGYIDGMSGLNTVTLDRAKKEGEETTWPDLEPKERREALAKARERGLRLLLTEAGFAEKAVQDAVVAFVNDQDTAREPLREAAAKLMDTVSGSAAGDTLVPGLLAELRAQVTLEKERHTKALAALDAQIGYTKNPRLDATLTVLGVIGKEAVSMEGDTAGSGVTMRLRDRMGNSGSNFGSKAMRPVIEKFMAMTDEQRKGIFEGFRKQMDTNNDGRVDRTERAEGHERVLKRFDRNANGKLDPDEMVRAMDSF